MKTLKKALAMFLAAGLMFGCGSKTETKTETAKFAKIGMATISSSGESYGSVQNETTVAVVGLTAEGKIAYCNIDIAQISQGSEDLRTKAEKGEDYGMKGASAIGKEWDEQAEFFTNYLVEKGLTKDEVAKLENGEGTDLASGCTVGIDEFKEAVVKAVESAIDCECDTVSMGVTVSANEKQTNTCVAAIGVKDGKVVKSICDVAQIAFGGDDMRSKVEKGEDYGMKAASSIGKEWFEQAEAFATYTEGKTAAEIAAIETYDKGDGHHTKVPAEGSDLASGCTIDIGAFQETYAKAFANA